MSIRIMAEVWQRALSQGETLVLLALADRAADDTGLAWPGVAEVARRARVSERQARRILRQLRKRGGLELVKRGGTSGRPGDTTVYRLRLDRLPLLPRLPRKTKLAIQEQATLALEGVSPVTPLSPSAPEGVTSGALEGVSPMSAESSDVSQPSERQSSSGDDDLAETLFQEFSKDPRFPALELQHVRFAVERIGGRASSPPVSLVFWRKSLGKFLADYAAELLAAQREDASRREARAGAGPRAS